MITAGDFSLRFDLQEEEVPRFTKNEIAPIAMSIFPVNTLTSPVKDEKKIAVLLPVVIVPGIASTRPDHMGGDYEFPQLEQFLKERTGMITNDGSGIYLSEGYQMRRDDGYWTLSTLRYDCNRSGLAKAAGVLHKHIEEVINQTYADKVYLIAHSQGGLISRKYIQAGNGRNRVKEYLQAQTPNTGSIYAIAGQLAGDTLNYSYQYYDLMPTFPHVQLYGAFYPQEEENIELKKMNGMLPGSDPDFPKNIPYTMIVSRSEQTWWGFKIIPNIPFSNIPLYLPLFCQGDSFVPAFSQLGLERDPNNSPDDPRRTLDNLKGERVPALRGANIQVQWINGAHAPEAEMNDLIDFISPRFPSIAQYKTPSTQTQAYLELDEVKNFIWCQKLGREFGCGLR